MAQGQLLSNFCQLLSVVIHLNFLKALAMDLEGLRPSLPADEGFKLCAELMSDYLVALSPEDRFRVKLDWVLGLERFEK